MSWGCWGGIVGVYGLYVVEVGNEECEREESQRVLLLYWHGRHADYRAPGLTESGEMAACSVG